MITHQNPVTGNVANSAVDSYMAQHHHQYDPWGGGGVNTLFVSGLPDDVKAREIHNLFRRRAGFDSCQIKYTGRGNQVVAFATFFNHQSAMASMHALNGVKFDPQTGSTLFIELARSNSRRKRKPGSGPYVVIDRRNRVNENTQEGTSDDDDARTSSPTEDGNPNDEHGAGSSAIVDEDELTNSKSEARAGSENTVANVIEQAQKSIDGDVRQCSTLFIANLGPLCTQHELKEALSKYPGFNVLRMHSKGGMPVAFADFEEVEQATRVMEELQASVLPSSDRGGMHIEYAKSKMRKPQVQV